MKYQQIINLLHDTSNQPSKFRTKCCIQINDDSHRCITEVTKLKFKL